MWNMLLIDLLILDGNEISMLEDNKTYKDFKSLIVEVAKASNDIRWCTNDKCSCHPESAILKLLNNKELDKFLELYLRGKYDIRGACSDYVPCQNKVMDNL